MEKVVIIGGVAGGMSAATRLRRLNESLNIVVFEKGPYVSFANCGLPYYVSGEIENRDSLLLQTPESLHNRFNIDVRVNHEVTGINPDTKTLTVNNQGVEKTESYDKLILSPGAKPFLPQIDGMEEAENVFTLRNVPDLDRIMNHLKDNKIEKALVIGAGFIGLEMAENLKAIGLDVTIVEKAPHILPTLDEEMAAFVSRELETNHVKVVTGQSATKFSNKGRSVYLEDGQKIETDLIILSIGVQPDSRLAEEAGLELGLRGGIVVNEHYQTSDPDIYAVGDAIIVKQQLTGEDSLISLASPANRQGRQVADVLSALNRKNKGSIGTAIVRVFGITAASTGLTERLVKNSNLNYKAVHTTNKDHASYYPGATDIQLKLIFDPTTGKIYGAQAVGAKGVDKRIDVLATAIKGGLTIFDLPELELTYAPPFGSAKDPVNMIGYVAMNIAEELSDNIQWHELLDELANGAILLDVRSKAELANGQFKDAIHIPLDELRQRIDELDREQTYIISCHSGLRSYLAERLLKQHQFKVKNLDGAFSIYQTVRPEEIRYV